MNGIYLENRLFTYALLLSLIIHIASISFLSSSRLKMFNKPFKQIEITYRTLKPIEISERENKYKDVSVIKKKKLFHKVKVLSKKEQEAPYSTGLVKDISKLDGKLKLNKKRIPKITALDMNKKVTIPLLKSEKITNPRYLSYDQNMRRMIKQRAYSYVDHPDFEEGEVYLTFVVGSNGAVKQIKVLDDKTSANSYLRSIGLRSIKDCDPFPLFPKDLDYPELTFNVLISFEVKD